MMSVPLYILLGHLTQVLHDVHMSFSLCILVRPMIHFLHNVDTSIPLKFLLLHTYFSGFDRGFCAAWCICSLFFSRVVLGPRAQIVHDDAVSFFLHKFLGRKSGSWWRTCSWFSDNVSQRRMAQVLFDAKMSFSLRSCLERLIPVPKCTDVCFSSKLSRATNSSARVHWCLSLFEAFSSD